MTLPEKVELAIRSPSGEIRWRGKLPRGAWLRETRLSGDGPLIFPCGGFGDCGECCVRFICPQAPPVLRLEQAHLGPDQLKDGWRLACCMQLWEDTELEAAPGAAPAAGTRIPIVQPEEIPDADLLD